LESHRGILPIAGVGCRLCGLFCFNHWILAMTSSGNTSRHRLNAPLVSSEVIDGEVIIIHLDNGNYYSMQGVGEWIWSRLVAGETTDHIAQHVTRHYECDQPLALRAVDRLVAELLAEGLIVPTSGAGAEAESAASGAGTVPRADFHEPVLNKYTDMQNLLMVDPIHEVTEQGWPMRADAESRPGDAPT